MKELKDCKYLIIEDEEKNRDLLIRVLLDENEVKDENIREAENYNQAKELIEEFEPNIILLDLNIPLDKGYEPDIMNSYELIQKIELYNFKQADFKEKIKIIVISGSIKEKGVQKIISLDKNRVFDFIDKVSISTNPTKFKEELKKKILKAIVFEGNINPIDYSFIRNSLIKPLTKCNIDLWDKIDEQILQQFEKLSDKKSNEYLISEIIIIKCGQIIEDIIYFFTNNTISIEGVVYSDDENSVLKKLTKLSGRNHIGFVKENNLSTYRYETVSEQYIRRISQEYAHMAYRMSSQARHSRQGDDNNNKWFAGYNAGFTKEDAAISINLIVPLIQDYINFMNKK